MNANKNMLMSYYDQQATHLKGTFDRRTLSFVYDLLEDMQPHFTVESGCGASTLAFALTSKKHIAFCLDDRNGTTEGTSSLDYVMASKLITDNNVEFVFGPTQNTLPAAKKFQPIDVALIDGPHGYPFPELEYYYFHQHLRTGSVLIIDDLKIPSVRHMFAFLREDAMFDEMAVLSDNTAFLRRNGSPGLPPLGDRWWEHNYNRRRLPAAHPCHLPR
jgi:predicted O-methyltransferase YrrM